MPINRLLKGMNLEPERVEALNRAFDLALRSLRLADRNDPITEIVAEKIIEIEATGVRDPVEISESAVKQLRPLP
jgi:hypothetical protein